MFSSGVSSSSDLISSLLRPIFIPTLCSDIALVWMYCQLYRVVNPKDRSSRIELLPLPFGPAKTISSEPLIGSRNTPNSASLTCLKKSTFMLSMNTRTLPLDLVCAETHCRIPQNIRLCVLFFHFYHAITPSSPGAGRRHAIGCSDWLCGFYS